MAKSQDEATEQHTPEQGLGTQRVGRAVPGTWALGKIWQCAVPKQSWRALKIHTRTPMASRRDICPWMPEHSHGETR